MENNTMNVSGHSWFEENSSTHEKTEWTEENALAAKREGWIISHSKGSMNGDWQVQKIDNPEDFPFEDGTLPPQLESDNDAWCLVIAKTKAHHRAALAFILQNNPQEAVLIKKADC